MSLTPHLLRAAQFVDESDIVRWHPAFSTESGALRPFTMRFARMIGAQEFDSAVDYLRAGLKGDKSDVASLEMIAECHRWARCIEEAIFVCRKALELDPGSFEMHSMLAQLLAENGEHEDAAIHARKGLECYPEPMPEVPRFVDSAFKALSRFVPSLRSASSPNEALRGIEASRAEWFDWAKKYLSWYDTACGETVKPVNH